VADLLGDSTLVEADAAVRTARYTEALQQAMAGKPPWPKELLAQAQSVPGPLGRMLAVCASLIQARATFGAASIGLYIISMAQHVDDVLAVLLLAHAAGLTEPDGEGGLRVPLQIAPLFETVPDLERAAIVCEALFAHPLCRAHIRSQSDRQEIMLGYSDSNKESGLVASRAALLAAEEALVAVAARHGITLRLFHGRGGTVSRGGSKPRQAILTSADPSCDLRITEQGEIISAKYGLEELALRTLELMGGALLERQLRPEPAGVPARFRAALEVCAAASRQAYRQLVVQTPGFFEYFNLATPIDVITRLRIGSRPPSRRACNGLEDLRAIPWVFAWMQNRQMLPAWYGLGQGLAACSEQFGPDHLCGMYARWPFFRQLLDDAAMGLAKCDMQVGALYARLAGPSHEPIWRTIAQSFDDTVAQVARVTGHPELLSHEPVLLRGIQRRNPAIDPMSLMQLDALQKWRASGRTDDGLLRLLMLCVKGIAEGLHNTG
jgi:phosphoenolpyruvate carboxylase